MLAPLGGPAWLPGAHGDEHVMDTQLRGVLRTLTLVEHTQEQAVLLGTFSRQIPRLGHSTRSQLLGQVSTRHTVARAVFSYGGERRGMPRCQADRLRRPRRPSLGHWH